MGRYKKGGTIDRILGPDGKLVGFAKTTRDMTERRVAQRQLTLWRI